MKVLGSINHPNIVKLLGYCVEGNKKSGMQRFLVYENKDCINLGKRIFEGNNPFFDTYMIGSLSRLIVARDVACGLACLHEVTGNKVFNTLPNYFVR